jgi:hypothetical protein
MIRETYKWLVAPMQEHARQGLVRAAVGALPSQPRRAELVAGIERVLKEDELLINEWAPIHLARS